MISAAGLEFIKGHEQFRSTVYNDPGGGNPTIGYGHKIKPNERFSSSITQAQALQILAQDVAIAEAGVMSCVRVALTQPQLDALISLVFNWGAKDFCNSILLSRLNAGDYIGAANRLGEWPITSGGVVLAGLKRRRQEEKAMFLSGTNVTGDSGDSGDNGGGFDPIALFEGDGGLFYDADGGPSTLQLVVFAGLLALAFIALSK